MYPIMTGKHYPTMGGKNNPAIDTFVQVSLTLYVWDRGSKL